MRSSTRIRNVLIIAIFIVATTYQTVAGQTQNWEETSSNDFECPLVSERRAWNDLSCEEQDAFLTNIHRLKANGVYDAFVRVHVENERAAHGTAEFLPWHRWFIHQFELALRSVADPPYRCMSLPYWDWELDAGNERISSVFSRETFSSFEGTRRNGRCRFPIYLGNGLGSCLRRAFNFDFVFWGEGRVVALIRGYSQYGDDFPNNPNRVNGFRAALEGGPHAAIHNFIGGSMTNQNAPNDPLFWIHHANVDRIWSLWQDYHGHTNVPFHLYNVPRHYEGSLLDVPMAFAVTKSWDFRIRNLRPPTPREVLSNNGVLMNVRYVHKNPIPSQPGYTPNRQWFGAPALHIDQCFHRLNADDPRRRLNVESQLVEEEMGEAQWNTTSSGDHTFLRGLGRNDHLVKKRSSIFPSRLAHIDSEKNEEQNSVNECKKANNFRRPQDKLKWDKLCNNLPQTHATIEERLNQLAIQDCDEIGNRPSAVEDDWIERMGMSDERVAFDCYHIADENERPYI